ncbi:MAG TPA: hypothetical protein VK137_14275, partial [Planctomycetaceae bacterium]|nr:hypothetical protein [Planctomycetaceae bacterium]
MAIATKLAERKASDTATRALQVRHRAKLTNMPLSDFVEHIGKLTKLRIRLDVAALKPEGIATDTPITLNTRKPMPASTLLRRALHPILLTWLLEDGGLVVTTRSVASQRQEIRLYPVGRLLRLAAEREKTVRANSPPQDAAPSNFVVPPLTVGPALTRVIIEETGASWAESSGEGGTVNLVGT